ncbi:stromal interaction molecule 2-like [Oncorhynchus kisutch]|uniref:stromal interaction molecule 2-like n=1 Tax=Oncorhynchus kisutch TaxID=8019 RepID=UPI0012DE57B2|nr:stromal interaction molecule 2-like [Oncorhynchus kisutch]
MMLLLSPVLLLLLRGVLFEASQGIIQDSGYYHHNDPELGLTFAGQRTVFDSTDPCLVVSPPCMNEADRYSLEGLRNIHREMDDDQDGGIEVEESVEFIIEDMKQQPTNKHSRLHREDQHITIEELWRGWKFSEVHNWTQDEVLRWLREFVELPQYEKNFKDFRVNGNTLPRIAANEPSFLSGQLKIVDQRDKQKLNIKALDAVLFGAPIRPPHNYMKDLLLIVSVMMGVGGCWFSQVQNKASKVHISKMMKDLESLQNAELSLRELQEQLEQAQEEKRNVTEEKQNLEEKMRDEIMGAQEEAHRLHRLRAGAVSQLSRLRYAEEELEQVRGALKKAEKDMMAYWSVPEALQLWLQLTHEVEVQYYNIKKHSAELQLNTAKEEAEKIKKKRSSLMGTFHVAHSSSLDDVDTKILEAKNALSEVTACLRERLHRWQQIERLCGFPLLRNSGLASLTATLYSDSNWVAMPRVSVPTFPSCHETIQGSLEDLMEDPSASILVPPMKRSPRSRGSTSTVCRQRRSGHASSSSSSSSYSDPDILIPIHTTLPCFEEEEQIFINAQWRGDSQVIYSDRTPPVSRRSSEPSGTESPICKISREELEASLDEATLKTSSKDESDSSSVDNTAPRKMQRVKSETSMDPPANAAAKKVLGHSMDNVSRKSFRDECHEVPLETHVSKKRSLLSTDMIGVSLDTGSRQMMRESRGEASFNNSMRGRPREEMVAAVGTPTRRISREEEDFLADSAQRRMAMARDKLTLHLDCNSSHKMLRKKMEFSVEPPSAATRKISIDEHHEMCSHTSRRTNSDKIDRSIDTPTGKIYPDRVDSTPEILKRRISREEYAGSSQLGHDPQVLDWGQFGQPDLTLSTPWKQTQTPDPYTPDLTELVYDGILEKSCITPATTPDLPQRITEGREREGNPPVPPPRSCRSLNTLPPEMRGERHQKDKDKSTKSSKLKSLFKKRKDHTPELPQGGLNNL